MKISDVLTIVVVCLLFSLVMVHPAESSEDGFVVALTKVVK